MSTRYQHAHEIPDEALCARLDELSGAVTRGLDAIAREFTMRIPAELDRDADLVLSEAAKRLRKQGSGRVAQSSEGDQASSTPGKESFAGG